MKFHLLRRFSWFLLLVTGSQLFIACDGDDSEEELVSLEGLWTYDSQVLEFFLNGNKLSDEELENFYLPILGVELSDFEIPEGATFEFKADGTFEGNATGFDTQTGNWLLINDEAENKTFINLSSQSSLLFLDLDGLPELARDVFLEEDGSIQFEVLNITETDAGFFLSGESQLEDVPLFGTANIRVDLTINLVR